jgi:hypothetical protein
MNQLFGQQGGINNTSMLGANASDSLGHNIFAQGSYFFNRVGNQNDQSDHRQYLLGGDSTTLYDQTSSIASTNYNNRINSRVDWITSSLDELIILPVLYFQSNRSGDFLNATTEQSSGGSQSVAISAETLTLQFRIWGITTLR